MIMPPETCGVCGGPATVLGGSLCARCTVPAPEPTVDSPYVRASRHRAAVTAIRLAREAIQDTEGCGANHDAIAGQLRDLERAESYHVLSEDAAMDYARAAESGV